MASVKKQSAVRLLFLEAYKWNKLCFALQTGLGVNSNRGFEWSETEMQPPPLDVQERGPSGESS